MKFAKGKILILFTGDLLLLYLALLITVKIRYFDNFNYEIWSRHFVPFTLVFIIWLIIFYINNLYSVQLVKDDFKFYGYLIQNLIINTFIGFTFFYLSPASLTSLKPLKVLIVLILIYTALFLIWRKLFYLFTSSKKMKNNVVFIGLNNEAVELADEMHRNPQYGYSLALIVNPDQKDIPPSLSSIPHVKELVNLGELIKKHKIQTLVSIGDHKNTPDVSRYLFETLKLGLNYTTFPDFYEKLTGKVPVASLEKDWFLENLLSGNKKMYEFVKRVEDLVFATFFGLLSLLLIPFIIIGVKLSGPGPIMFKQKRTGKGGKFFMAMKFRTMVVDAEQNGPQWAAKNDSRVTKVGKFLRKTRLDEIPQFINILKGDMSFVGPRPERPEFVTLLSQQIPFYKERLLVKPGLSGWAQINFKYGESVKDAMVKLQYDLFYIKNRSFTLDVSVVLKTISTVINASLGQ